MKNTLSNMNINADYGDIHLPAFNSYGNGYLNYIQHTGARYNYSMHNKWVFFYNNIYTLLQCIDGWDRRRFRFIVNIENGSWNTHYNCTSFINATVVQSLAELETMKHSMMEYGYTMVHEENNWFMLAPNNNNDWEAHLLVMHRNVDRNQLIDDALTYVANKLIEYFNTSCFTSLGITEVLTVEQLSVDEPEIVTLDNWYAALKKLEADELAAREERKAHAAEVAEGITEKFITRLVENAKPVVRGKFVPLHSNNRKEELANEIESYHSQIKELTRHITNLYLTIDDKEREYMSMLCGTNNEFNNLIEVLNKMLANDSPLRYYNLTNGRLELYFINPITYWEDDEIDQWHNTEPGAKWIDLITSKRFQVMTACKVIVNTSVSGTSIPFENSSMHDIISDYVQQSIINEDSKADDDNMWSHINDYFTDRIVVLDSYRGHYVKQPHIARFSCFGNNEHSIIEAFRNCNYELGMSIIVHCVTQLNLTDGTVVCELCGLLEDAMFNNIACIWDTETQQYLTPDNALAMFNNAKEAEANETN